MMNGPNYESVWWGYIYDQMMAEQQDLLDAHLRFYRTQLGDVTGSVLECACGTGLMLLPLLADGYDMYGFDISPSMLATLRRTAAQHGVGDIAQRIAVQDLESFRYDQRFAAILIPSNSIVMLPTQDAQIRALATIASHLAPGGRLLFDVRLAGVRDLADGTQAVQGRWHTWRHPETGRPIRQRVDGRIDFDSQRILDQCFIEYDEVRVTFPMTTRWIFKEELVLLLRLTGFTRWAWCATPEGDPLELGPEEQHSYWMADKGGSVVPGAPERVNAACTVQRDVNSNAAAG
jgi:SAM-dependent methyltransferase